MARAAGHTGQDALTAAIRSAVGLPLRFRLYLTGLYHRYDRAMPHMFPKNGVVWFEVWVYEVLSLATVLRPFLVTCGW